jgi:hypothetical protein
LLSLDLQHDRPRGPLALVIVIACGGCASGKASNSGSAPGTAGAAFVGVWNCSGTQVETCGISTHSDTSDFTMTVTEGAANGIATAVSNNVGGRTGTNSGSGTFDWTVSGNEAGLNVPLTLPTGPGSVGGTWTPTYSTGSLSFSGEAVLWNASGTAVYINGATQRCDFTQSYACSAANGLTVDASAEADGDEAAGISIPDAGPDANLFAVGASQCGAFDGVIGPTGPSFETTCTEFYGPTAGAGLTPGRCPAANVACTCLTGNDTGSCTPACTMTGDKQ